MVLGLLSPLRTSLVQTQAVGVPGGAVPQGSDEGLGAVGLWAQEAGLRPQLRGLQPMLGFVYSCDHCHPPPHTPPPTPVLEVLLLSHFTEEEIKAWRGQITCLVTLAWAEQEIPMVFRKLCPFPKSEGNRGPRLILCGCVLKDKPMCY